MFWDIFQNSLPNFKGWDNRFLFYLIVISKSVPAHLKKIESETRLFKKDIKYGLTDESNVSNVQMIVVCLVAITVLITESLI